MIMQYNELLAELRAHTLGGANGQRYRTVLLSDRAELVAHSLHRQ